MPTVERVPRLFGRKYITLQLHMKPVVWENMYLLLQNWSKVYNWNYNKPRAECTTDILMNRHVAELIPKY